jgi:hypothetical protein
VLANGQIWQQTESWSLSRPQVLIYQSGGAKKLCLDQIDRDVSAAVRSFVAISRRRKHLAQGEARMGALSLASRSRSLTA